MVIRRTTDRRLCAARALAIAVLAVGALWGCGPAVQFERTAPPGTYVVRNGDTLFNIAWRYGLDHRDLSRWNGIRNPNRIYPGQRLRLTGKAASTQRRRSTSASTSKPKPKPAPQPKQPAPAWQWPADGGLVSRFGDANALGQGVGIGGKEGQRIKAAGSGRVVYNGSGLIGYGKLVIIKHNDTYLSAYGYNKTVSVKEGDQVKAGQVIGRMGRGPGNRAMLHFEIRQNGGPIDPLSQLPKR
jgi:lipoprotein NlpD